MNLLNQLKNIATEVTGSSGPSQNWYITAERAEGIHSKDIISKSDPYLTIEFGGKKVRTRSLKNDLSPSWNETFNFKIPSNNAKDIHVTLTDDDFGFDDSIGAATISKGDLPIQPGEEKCFKVPVYKKEKVNGVVHIRVKFMVDGQSSSSNPNYQSNVSSNYYPQQSQQPTYHQSQQPMYNQPQQPMYNQSQPYNQNPQFQGQGPPMTNQPYPQQQQQYSNQPQQQQPYSNQPYSQQQQPYSNQPNPNYRGNQY